MKVYGRPAEALEDAMRLSAAMTRKLAIAGLPFGGGKAVIAVPEIPSGEQSRALFLRYADLVASLGGTFRTSSDINTGEADMDVIGERTEYVFGRSVQAGGSGSPAPPTAVGVYHGIRASLTHAFGSDDLEGRIVVVQGAGGVGSPLADHLANAGASVLVADIDPGRAHAVAARVGGVALPADQLFDPDSDVSAPCAVGGILSVETVPQLRCRIVAGSANNQLAEPEAADLLHARGILYAPDYVINAGGAIAIVGLEQLGWSKSELDTALARIGETLRQIYERADALDGGSRRRACRGAAESTLAGTNALRCGWGRQSSFSDRRRPERLSPSIGLERTADGCGGSRRRVARLASIVAWPRSWPQTNHRLWWGAMVFAGFFSAR